MSIFKVSKKSLRSSAAFDYHHKPMPKRIAIGHHSPFTQQGWTLVVSLSYAGNIPLSTPRYSTLIMLIA